MYTRRPGFTLIELLIAITIVGILSMLLFRTLGDMMRISARVQNEKALNQELMTLQTTINLLSEQYPYIYMTGYQNGTTNISGPIGANGYIDTLHLTDNKGGNISIYSTGDCETACHLEADMGGKTIQITNPKKSKIHDVMFKIIPITYYTTGTIYDHVAYTDISAEGFWIFGRIQGHDSPTGGSSSYTLQHFTNLQQ